MKLLRTLTLTLTLTSLLSACQQGAEQPAIEDGDAEQYVIEDGGVGLTREELQYLVKLWSPDMMEAAIKDPGDRIELLNMALASKKLAALAPTIPASDNPEAYWKQVFTIRSIQARYAVNHFVDGIEVPDMTALAAERYQTEKDKYALVPEERYSSHILLLCEPGVCDRDARRVEAQKILDELKAGADFRELAGKYSEDPGSKDEGGQFDAWLTMGTPNVAPHYLGGLFEIAEVGGYSGIVDTRFGLHIIRLDDKRPAHYKPYEEVKDAIIGSLRTEYIKLAAKQYDAGFRLTDKAVIDNAAVDEILAPYQAESGAPAEAEPAAPVDSAATGSN
jgi:peptidyl-prolyl cis-trans isomerase C